MKRYPESFAGHVTGRLLLKKLVQLFAVLLVAGCGEKSSSEGSDSAGASAEPPADTAKQNPAGSPVADSPSESATPPSEDVKPSADSPKPLISDADAERLLKEAVDMESLEERDGLLYLNDEPYSGWGKWHVHFPEYIKVKKLHRFKDGQMDGPSVEWHANGQKWFERTYKDGELDGSATEWYEDGRLASERIWNNGDLVAVTVWMPNGDKCANTKFENGTGKVYGYSENGQKISEGTYKDGKEEGPQTQYYENGKKFMEYTYKDGQLDGLETLYYENGQKESEVTYKDGNEEGPQTQYYENGKKFMEYTYKDGLQVGLSTTWYESGQKKEETTFKEGVPHGLWIEWHENGEKKAEGTYKEGERDGLWTSWDNNGQKMDEENYKDPALPGETP